MTGLEDSVQFTSVDVYLIIDIFLLLLIGVGPKIALLPFLSVTRDLDEATKRRVIRKMLVMVSVTGVVLIVFGGILARLLHFSTSALGIAGGIILMIIAVRMVISPAKDEQAPLSAGDPMRLAVYPLAVPYLLNPAGIVVLVTVSAEARPIGLLFIVLGLLALVIAIDAVVFRAAIRVSGSLDEGRMLLVEKVFGFLLAALAVQLVLNALADLGVLHPVAH